MTLGHTSIGSIQGEVDRIFLTHFQILSEWALTLEFFLWGTCLYGALLRTLLLSFHL